MQNNSVKLSNCATLIFADVEARKAKSIEEIKETIYQKHKPRLQ